MNPDIKVNWEKGLNGWIPFDRLNLQSSDLNDAYGIYILWSSDSVLKIGYGRIRDELAKDKTNRQIAEHKDLMVTWCQTIPEQLEGVLNYLISRLKPKLGVNTGEKGGIELAVNIPWHKNFI